MPELMLGAFWLGRMFFQLKNGCNKAKIRAPDYEKYRPLLGWIPLPTVKRTFEATTQLVQELPMRYPLRRHVEARFPQLNRRRLTEVYSTDTLFSSHGGIGGLHCAQLFCGNKSHFTSIHGMKSESEGPDALEDFIRVTAPPLFSKMIMLRCKQARSGMKSYASTVLQSRPQSHIIRNRTQQRHGLVRLRSIP